MTSTARLSAEDYSPVLAEYLQTRGEQALYKASLLSRSLVQAGMGPEDIVALHADALDALLSEFPPREQVRAMGDAHQFLLEIMIGYGVHYKEYLELKLQENLHDLEARMSWEHDRALEAERVGREKEEILSIIAHELRQPLTAARGYLDLMERLIARGETQRIPTQILRAREALDRLSRLSGDLVEASRQEMPQLALAPVDVRPILGQVRAWVLASAEANGIKVDLLGETEPLLIQGNADALLSIFGNLVSNAVRYTPAGGRVTLGSEPLGDEIAVTVKDTGIGMSPETQQRIFEKFYRAPEAREVESRGLGLGLSLVQQLVLAHGGRVEIKSTPGQGSAFRVILPRALD